MRSLWIFSLAIALSACGADKHRLVREQRFTGMSDASAGGAITTNLFAAASDEDNILRIYDLNKEGLPVGQLDCNQFLEIPDSTEADLEGAARIGDRIFWIGSHGRNKKGKPSPNRCRFFATDIRLEKGNAKLVPAGKPCKTLLESLCQEPSFEKYHLAAAASKAPKDPDALNIEGLSATPEGHILIGFRNPVPAGKTLIIPLANPNEVIQGAAPRFDPAIELDLGGLGVRDMVWTGQRYWIIAGSYDGGHHSKVYQWAGPGKLPEFFKAKHLRDLNPEALLYYPESQKIQILSDDGTLTVDGTAQKRIPDPGQRSFRSVWLEPEF